MSVEVFLLGSSSPDLDTKEKGKKKNKPLLYGKNVCFLLLWTYLEQ